MRADELEIKTFTVQKPKGGSHTATPSTWMMKALRESNTDLLLFR